MARYEIRQSQFGIISSIAQPTSDMALAAESSGLFAPEARKGQLYIIAEAEQEGRRGRDACHTVIRTIHKAFYEDTSFSVTASLRKAIIAANKALYQQNFSASPQKRGLVGVTCAVFKDGDLYIAQIAPCQMIVLCDGRLRAIPPSPNWDTTPSPPTPLLRMSALGASLTVEPEFARAVLRPGDAALVCTSNLSKRLERDTALRLLRAGDPQGSVQSLVELCSQQGITDAHGILIGVFAPLSPAAQAAPLSSVGISERVRMAFRATQDVLNRASGEIVLIARGPMERLRLKRAGARVDRNEQDQRNLTEMPDQPTHSPNPPSLPRPIDLGEPINQQIAQDQDARQVRLAGPAARPIERQRSLPPSAMLGESGYGGAVPTEKRINLGDPIPRANNQRGLQSVAPSFDERPNGPLSRINSYFTQTSRKRRMRGVPQRVTQQPRRTPGLSYRREAPAFPWLWLLALVSLVMILLLYGVTLSNQNQIREADSGLSQAEQAVAQIYAASDESTAQARLREAAQAIANIQATGTITATIDGRQRFEALQREYNRALTSIQKVSYFDTIDLFARNPQPGAFFDNVIIPPLPRGITDTTSFASIYMLDTNTGVLYRQPKTGGSIEPILRPQDTFGPLTVGRVLGATWRFDTIVAVTQNTAGGPYNFYFRTDNTWSYSILAGSEEWGRPGDHFRIANYQGNLYVWGADPANVLRYRSGEYGSFPDPWIKNDGGKKFDSSLDLAVDGKLYLLQPDGRILVFASTPDGDRAFEREIIPKGIEPALRAASRFFITGEPESGSIFLVEGYYNRVIQIDKITGQLIQQIMVRPDSARQLDNLINLAVDTNAGRPVLYLVNGSDVLRAPLPDPPRPFRENTPATTPTVVVTPTP